MAHDLVGSEILRIAADIARLKGAGKSVIDLTVGDFWADEFPIPGALLEGIVRHYRAGATTYPPSSGMMVLRQAVADTYRRDLGLACTAEQVLIAAGARPLIYATYLTVLDPGDGVAYPVPSWNNNHYCHLAGAVPLPVPTTAATAFQPTAAQLLPHLGRAALVVLTSPQNPAGTCMPPEELKAMCQAVIQENEQRKLSGQKPLYLLYDHIYRSTLFNEVHHTPTQLVPEMADYTIYVDGISKSWAATGVRVGWAVGPPAVVQRMSAILTHVGAWAPKAEQLATADLLNDPATAHAYERQLSGRLQQRLNLLKEGLHRLRTEGYPLNWAEPEGALYLALQVPALGQATAQGEVLTSTEAIRAHLLEEAGLGLVPFDAFGMRQSEGWFRLSVAGLPEEELAQVEPRLRAALQPLFLEGPSSPALIQQIL